MPANDPEKKTSPVSGFDARPWRYQAGFVSWLVLIHSPGSAADADPTPVSAHTTATSVASPVRAAGRAVIASPLPSLAPGTARSPALPSGRSAVATRPDRRT